MQQVARHRLPKLHLENELQQEVRLFGSSNRVAAVPSQPGVLDTPRVLEPLVDEDQLRDELEEVKADRAALLRQLAAVRAAPSEDWQQRDVDTLRGECTTLKAKHDQLIAACRRLHRDNHRAQLRLRDCVLLTPVDPPDVVQRIAQLEARCTELERDAGQAAVRNQLYLLLLERTRREHHAADQRVRAATRLRDLAQLDLAAMQQALTAARRAREAVELQMRNADFVFQEVARDWQIKLRDRHAEAREVQRRQAAALQRNAEARAAEEQSVRAHGARAQRAAAAAEKDAAQDAALQPELEELEIGWVLVRRAAGGGDVPDVVSHWQGLQRKEENLQELLRLTEARQAEARASLTRLLASRGATAAAETERPEADAASLERRLEAANRKAQEACKRVAAQQTALAAAQQGLLFLLDRVRVALAARPQQLPGGLRSVSEGFTPKASPKGPPRGPSNAGGQKSARRQLERQRSADAVSPAHQASTPRTGSTPRGLTEGEQPQALLKARTASVLDLVKQLSEVTAATVALEEARPPAPKTVSVVRMGSGVSTPSTLRPASSNASSLLRATTTAAAAVCKDETSIARTLHELGSCLIKLVAVKARLQAAVATSGPSGASSPELGVHADITAPRGSSGRAAPSRPCSLPRGMMPRRQLSSRHRSTSLLRRGLGSPGPRPEGRHAVLGRLVGYIPSDDGSPSQAASSMARDTGAEGGAAEEAVLRGGREAAKQRGGSRAGGAAHGRLR